VIAQGASCEPESAGRRVHLIQGEHYVTNDPGIILTTTLGSCVAACMRDADAGVGGMNHFLLPDGDNAVGPEAQRYGAYAMELLVNGLLRAGARRERLEVKLFGGARLTDRLVDVGAKNVLFAERFLAREGIAMARGSVRGPKARRLQFWPVSGRVRQLYLDKFDDVIGEIDRARSIGEADFGRVELF
jgi:chemotaxis protein CheD